MPKPEKHIFICVQNRPPGHPRPACAQKNAAALSNEFFTEQQRRQLFDKIQITTAGCLGPCTEGPSVLVYPEGVMYRGVKQEDVAEIFDEHLINGKPVERLLMPKEVWG